MRLGWLLLHLLLWNQISFGNQDSSRLLIHLLSYIGMDYSAAVSGSKTQMNNILSLPEYEEQISFVDEAIILSRDIKEIYNHPAIAKQLIHLKRMIENKYNPKLVESECDEIRKELLQALPNLKPYPSNWPNLKNGEKHYESSCVSCHGVTGNGDGPAISFFDPDDPRPPNFHSSDMQNRSPYQLFNTIRLGVYGTPMPSFPLFSEEETWDVVYYILSLRFTKSQKPQPIENEFQIPSLSELGRLSEHDWLSQNSNGNFNSAYLRYHLLNENILNSVHSLVLATRHLKKSLAEFESGHFENAKKEILLSYLEGIEPIESRLRALHPQLTTELEAVMNQLRQSIEKRLPKLELTQQAKNAENLIDRAKEVLSEKTMTPWVAFSLSAGIFFREALEAILILITLLGVIKSVKNRAAEAYVHAGWIVALVLGVAGWIGSGWVFNINGADRELMEGLTSLLAVLVLIYFGFWLHRKTEIGRWRTFLENIVSSALNKKHYLALFIVSFSAIFREAFETILFLRALLLECQGERTYWAVGLGVSSSFVAVLILTSFLTKFTKRIPVRELFLFSSFIMLVLSIILMGKSIHSFQESGLFTITKTPFTFRSDLIGIYPTYETCISQMIILISTIAYWLQGKFKFQSTSFTG